MLRAGSAARNLETWAGASRMGNFPQPAAAASLAMARLFSHCPIRRPRGEVRVCLGPGLSGSFCLCLVFDIAQGDRLEAGHRSFSRISITTSGRQREVLFISTFFPSLRRPTSLLPSKFLHSCRLSDLLLAQHEYREVEQERATGRQPLLLCSRVRWQPSGCGSSASWSFMWAAQAVVTVYQATCACAWVLGARCCGW